MTPQEREELDNLLRVPPKPSLADFVEATVNFKLHPWQREYLCPVLERCRTEKGLRIAIHKPPQYGGSVIVSQRLAPWLWGYDATHRFFLRCYNETHATGFGQVIKALLESDYYKETFPHIDVRKDAPASNFSTLQRLAVADGQPSFMALGLLSGFTGKAPDTLVDDDPYANAEDAFSETINNKTWRLHEQTTAVRLSDEANHIVMFHRYHEDDFAGRLLATGKYEYLRFPAVADENEDGSDPTGRELGELLSTMRSYEWLETRKAADSKTFYGQFQGKPRPDEGAFFQEPWFKIHEGPIPKLRVWVRYWDLAVSTKVSGDYTVGALLGIGSDNTIYLRDLVRFKKEWPDACNEIVAVASRDSLLAQKEDWSYQVGIDARLTQQGFLQDLERKAAMQRIPIWPDRTKGDKKERASGWAARAANDKFRMILGSWDSQAFIKECLAFDGSGITHDDQIDAVSGGYQLCLNRSGNKNEQTFIKPNTIEFYERLGRG